MTIIKEQQPSSENNGRCTSSLYKICPIETPSCDPRFTEDKCAGFPKQVQDASTDTSKLYQTVNLPTRFEKSYIFKGYGVQNNENANPVYRTTSSEYGWFTPNAHTVPQRYFPKSNEFTELLGKCGMYRNYSLNTVMDSSVF